MVLVDAGPGEIDGDIVVEKLDISGNSKSERPASQTISRGSMLLPATCAELESSTHICNETKLIAEPTT